MHERIMSEPLSKTLETPFIRSLGCVFNAMIQLMRSQDQFEALDEIVSDTWALLEAGQFRDFYELEVYLVCKASVSICDFASSVIVPR